MDQQRQRLLAEAAAVWPRAELLAALVARGAAAMDREGCSKKARPFGFDALVAIASLLRASLPQQQQQHRRQAKKKTKTTTTTTMMCRWCGAAPAVFACPQQMQKWKKRLRRPLLNGDDDDEEEQQPSPDSLLLVAFCSIRCMQSAHRARGHALCCCFSDGTSAQAERPAAPEAAAPEEEAPMAAAAAAKAKSAEDVAAWAADAALRSDEGKTWGRGAAVRVDAGVAGVRGPIVVAKGGSAGAKTYVLPAGWAVCAGRPRRGHLHTLAIAPDGSAHSVDAALRRVCAETGGALPKRFLTPDERAAKRRRFSIAFGSADDGDGDDDYGMKDE